MRKFLTGSILAIAAITTNAQSLEVLSPIEEGLTDVSLYNAPFIVKLTTPKSKLKSGSIIAIARLDGGRLIPTPYAETRDWAFLDRRTDTKITQLGSGNYIKYIPEIPFHGQDTDNKIDEIRLTAANEGMDYVLIYGVGPDASWASFGKKALSETGLTIREDCKSWSEAKAKALLVESHTGIVLGAVTSDNIEFNIGQLADRVGEMITDLTETGASKA